MRRWLKASLPLWILLLAGLVRFWGLGRESIWLDEATSIFIARMDPSEIIVWVAADIHPPLYYLLLHFWTALGQTESVVRALSALFGVGAVAVTWALARELFDSRVANIGALLLAVSPLHVFYSQEARMYVMAASWSTLASYMLILATRRGSNRYWLGYALTSVLALYTHYFALFTLWFQGLFVLRWLWKRRPTKRLARRWLMSVLVIIGAFLPWTPTVISQVLGGGGGWVERAIGRPTLYALIETWVQFSIGIEGRLYPAAMRRGAYLLYAACLLAALWAARRSRNESERQSRREALLFCAGYVAVPLLTIWLLSQVKPMYTMRYLLPFLPPYCIWVASGLRSIPWRWPRIATGVVLILVLLAGDWYTLQAPQKPDWRSASAYVAARVLPGDVALFSPRWNSKPFDYYAPELLELNLDLPVPTTDEAARAAIVDIGQRYRRVWFFWQADHYGDPSAIAKRLLDAQFRPVETREFRGLGSVILYQVQDQR